MSSEATLFIHDCARLGLLKLIHIHLWDLAVVCAVGTFFDDKNELMLAMDTLRYAVNGE